MKVLGIETSCDETAVAIVENGRLIHANIIASQSDLHAIYGGVVPELASRRHSELLLPMIDQALKAGNCELSDIDLVAATYAPGLMGALLVGLQTAKSLAMASNKPFIGINHIEAHLFSPWMNHPTNVMEDLLPALGVVISGGHTLVVYMKALGHYELISHSLDDAIGEAFDKVAVMLGLPYPGGPHIEKLALEGNPKAYTFKAPHVKKFPWHFSYSGLKTQVLYAIHGQNLEEISSGGGAKVLPFQQKCDLAASFQETVIQDLSHKLSHLALEHSACSVWVGGGVSANQTLRNHLDKTLPVPILWPSRELSVDNGAMIAGLAFYQYQHAGASPWTLPVTPRTALGSWKLADATHTSST